MNEQTAFDPTTRVGVNEAIDEVRKHGHNHPITIQRNRLMYHGDPLPIALIESGTNEVPSLDVLTWLGY